MPAPISHVNQDYRGFVLVGREGEARQPLLDAAGDAFREAYRRLAAGAARRGQRVGVLEIRVDVLAAAGTGAEVTLTEIGERVRGTIRCEDNLGRLPHGFAIAVSADSPGELSALANRLRAEIDHQPVAVPGLGEVRARAAIGGVLAAAGDLDQLLTRASAALADGEGDIVVDGEEVRAPATDDQPPAPRPPASVTGRAPVVLLVGVSELRSRVRPPLTALGCRVLEAQTLADSRALIAEDPPDVVLLEEPAADPLDGDALTVVVGGDAPELLRRGVFDVVTAGATADELVARIERTLLTKAARDELVWRVADVEAFALQAAHDLKSPLTIIGGMAAALAASDLTDNARLLAERLAAAGGRASTLIDDLLALAGFGTTAPPTVTPEPEPVIRAAVAGLSLTDATVVVSGEWEPVGLARAELAGVITNLVTNADRHGRDADGHLSLRFTGGVDDDVLVIMVCDGGPGFAPGGRDPFTPGTGRKAQAGVSGLGLALVRQTVARRGGTVAIGPGPGGQVELRLPRHLAE